MMLSYPFLETRKLEEEKTIPCFCVRCQELFDPPMFQFLLAGDSVQKDPLPAWMNKTAFELLPRDRQYRAVYEGLEKTLGFFWHFCIPEQEATVNNDKVAIGEEMLSVIEPRFLDIKTADNSRHDEVDIGSDFADSNEEFALSDAHRADETEKLVELLSRNWSIAA
jgi:hypothetical protein